MISDQYFLCSNCSKLPPRDMITNAWEWAKQNGKLFKSEVHGAEVISVNVEKFRKRYNEQGSRMTMKSAGTFEDNSLSILDEFAPTSSSKNEGESQVVPVATLVHMHAAIVVQLNIVAFETCGFEHPANMPCILRTKGPPEKLAFPSISQTTNPYLMLPNMLLVLGRKLDNALQLKAASCVIALLCLSVTCILLGHSWSWIRVCSKEKLDACPSCKRAVESGPL